MRRSERRVGIERKILTSILWVGIMPITIALVVGYVVVHETQRQAVLHNLSTAAEKTGQGLKFVLDSRLRTARTLARDPEIISAIQLGDELSEDKREALRARLKLEGASAEDGPSVYGLYDYLGRLVLTTEALPLDERFHPEWLPWVSKARIVGFEDSPEINRYTMHVVAPVCLPNTSKRVGFLLEIQGVSELLEFTLSPESPRYGGAMGADSYEVAFLGGSMKLVASLDPELSPSLRYLAIDPKLDALLNEPETAASGAVRLRNYETRGTQKDVLLAYYQVHPQEAGHLLYTVVYRPSAAVFSPINQWAIFSFLGGAVLIGLLCVVAYRNVHNNIVRPVSLLNEGAQIIRQGDLDLKLKIGTGDEIEELALSFNKMALALKRNIGQLEGSEEKYRHLVTSMRDGVYQTDAYGNFTFMNPAGAEILGHGKPEAVHQQAFRELFVDDNDFAEIENELANQSFVDRRRVWMKRKDGRAICVELSAGPLLDETGNAPGMEGLFRDVTKSVQLEQEARERTERIAAINQIANVINSSLEAGRLHESLVGELRKLVQFDYAAVALLNESNDAFEQWPLWPSLVSKPVIRPVPDAAVEVMDEHSRDEQSCTGWIMHHRKCLLVEDLHDEGCPFAWEFPENIRSCLCVPLYSSGRIIGALDLGAEARSAFSSHDTEVLEQMAPHVAVAMRNARLLDNLQQSLEEVTQAREKLHEANEQLKTLDEMKTNLLSNVSHELRTPLVAVMGYTDMISNRKVGPINDMQAEYLGIILRNVEKLVTLIENLLDFSRLHRGAEKMAFDTFDVVDCARTSIQIVEPVADGRDITIELNTPEDKVLVEGDRGKIGQVFNNLLSNAVKFNQNGGRVTVDIVNREDTVDVVVSDTGIGIPEEALDKVFTRFYQYDSSSTRKYGGTGIGLSIAQDIVRLHGGRITVQSEFDKGSTFRFSLPLKVARGESEDGEADLPAAPETEHLLGLVTQDRALSTQLREVLRFENMDVIQAAGPEGALALVRKHRPDCLLVDMEASGNGKSILDALLSEPTLLTIPVVMLTNDDQLFDQYRPWVAAHVKRSFRKSGLLSGLHLALSQPAKLAEPLGKKVLCVDDDPEILTFITRCLESEGYSVESCSNGELALRYVESREYGLVLLDIAMPGLDGWEVCRTLKANPKLAGLQVYLITAKPIESNASRVREVGADGYMLKPFRPEDLIELAHGAMPLDSVSPEPEDD